MPEPIIQPIQEPKLELEKDLGKSPLMVYFFIVFPPEIQVKNEKCAAIMSYDLETAITKAQIEAKGLGLFYTGQKTPITDLISKLHIEGIISPPTTEEKVIEPLPPKKLSKESFKAGLLLVLNEFLKVEEDKIKLKEIIEKL